MEMEKNTETKDCFDTEVVQQLLNSMKNEIDKLQAPSPVIPTIYKVPHIFHGDHGDAYQPKIVPIGPYPKREDPKLQPMAQHKWQYLSFCISQSSNPEKSLKNYVDGIKKLEVEVRGCYSAGIELSSSKFVEMLVLDGCFIIGLFLKHYHYKFRRNQLVAPVDDPLFAPIWMVPAIKYDLLMLENQIPFFILEYLFKVTAPQVQGNSLCQLALFFFQGVHFFRDVNGVSNSDQLPSPKHNNDQKIYHLLHLLHANLISTINSEDESSPQQLGKSGDNVCLPMRLLNSMREKGSPSSASTQHPVLVVPSASEMYEAGLEFKKREKANSLLDIEFEKNKIIIPPLSIFDSTESLFRNLIAMEQCIPNSETRFTRYASFMDCLINTEKDVGLLYRKEIIEHTLGSGKEVALLFNRLCKDVEIDFNDLYLRDLYESVNNFCKEECNRKFAYWRQKYFSHPWSRFTLMAGLIVFFITIGQFVLNLLAKLHKL